MAIPEELLLLHRKRQLRGGGVYLGYGLAGAVLAELLLRNRIVVRSETLSVFDARFTGDEILDEALAAIGRSPRQRSVKWWITSLHQSMKQLEQRYGQRLPPGDELVSESLRTRLRNALLLPEGTDAHTATLIALCEASRIGFLSRDEARHVRQRLRDAVRTNAIAAAVAAAVTDTEAVLLAMVTG